MEVEEGIAVVSAGCRLVMYLDVTICGSMAHCVTRWHTMYPSTYMEVRAAIGRSWLAHVVTPGQDQLQRGLALGHLRPWLAKYPAQGSGEILCQIRGDIRRM